MSRIVPPDEPVCAGCSEFRSDCACPDEPEWDDEFWWVQAHVCDDCLSYPCTCEPYDDGYEEPAAAFWVDRLAGCRNLSTRLR